VIVHTEAQRADQPEFGPQRYTGAADVAGVVGDLRLVQHDVEHGSVDELDGVRNKP
jgi:hypothetical protein